MTGVITPLFLASLKESNHFPLLFAVHVFADQNENRKRSVCSRDSSHSKRELNGARRRASEPTERQRSMSTAATPLSCSVTTIHRQE